MAFILECIKKMKSDLNVIKLHTLTHIFLLHSIKLENSVNFTWRLFIFQKKSDVLWAEFNIKDFFSVKKQSATNIKCVTCNNRKKACAVPKEIQYENGGFYTFACVYHRFKCLLYWHVKKFSIIFTWRNFTQVVKSSRYNLANA